MEEIKNEAVVEESKDNGIAEAVMVSTETSVVEEQQKPKKNVLVSVKNMFSPQRRKKTISLMAATVVLIVAVICVLNYLSPKNVAVRFAKADWIGDPIATNRVVAYDYYAYLLEDSTEEEFFENLSDKWNEDITSWKDISKYQLNYSEEWAYEWYGKYTETYKTARIKDMSIRRLEEEHSSLLDEMEAFANFDRDDISKIKEATVKMKIEGEDDFDRITFDIILVKVGGFWKGFYCDYDWDD